MTRFAGRPWMAAAFVSFVVASLALFAIAPLWFIALPLGLAFMTLDMTRQSPLPRNDPESDDEGTGATR
jgi:hypothetical protein